MKKFSLTLAAAAGLATFGQAHAYGTYQSTDMEVYVGGQYNYQEVKVSGQSNPKLDALTGRIGLQAGPYFSGEARLGLGISDDEGVRIENYFGFYARAGLANETQLTPYLIGGWTEVRTKLDSPFGGQKVKNSTDGGSYGAGVDFHLDQHLALNLEYMRLLDKSDADLDAVNIGISYRF